MNVSSLIGRAVAAGVVFAPEGDGLRVRWPKGHPPSAELLAALRARKGEILARLTGVAGDTDSAGTGAGFEREPADWRIYFEERAAIGEHDHGLSRPEAETAALNSCVNLWLCENPLPASDASRCVQCGGPEPDTPVLARGGHAWLHGRCWRPMWEAQNAKAHAAVRAMLGGSAL